MIPLQYMLVVIHIVRLILTVVLSLIEIQGLQLDFNIMEYQKQYQELLEQAKTINFLIVDNEIKAMYALRDEIKGTTKDVIERLKARDIKTYMITGDNKGVAKRIGYEIGIDQVYCEVLPNEKAEIVKEIQEDGHITAFVGDGIRVFYWLCAIKTIWRQLFFIKQASR